jgi:hypothetical protein
MRSRSLLAGLSLLALALPARATLVPFSDNFETGFNGANWPKWPTASDHLNSSNNRSHAGGMLSVRQDPEDPATLANYHDFGATSDAVTASVWVWDDNSATGTASQPVNIMAIPPPVRQRTPIICCWGFRRPFPTSIPTALTPNQAASATPA